MTSSAGLLQEENAVSIVRGASRTFVLTVTDTNDKVVDLTGAVIYFTVKERVDDRSPVIFKSSVNPSDILITNPKGGVAEIYLNPADTKDKEAKEYVFDVWAALSSGKRYPVVDPSTFEIRPGVTVIA